MYKNTMDLGEVCSHYNLTINSLLRRQNESEQQLKRLSKVLRRRDSSNDKEKFKIWNLVVIIPCLIASLYHASQITEVYLKYDVTAEALFYPADVLVPPMVTLCMNNNYATPCDGHCLKNSTRFFNAIYKIEEIIGLWGRWIPGHKFVRYENMSLIDFARRSVTTYRINNMSCYAIDFAREFDKNYTFMDAHANSYSLMVQINVYAKACNDSINCLVYVTRAGNLNLKSHAGKPLVHGYRVALNYQKQELNLLPPPYTTKCFDYAKQGIHSQDECIAHFERKLIKESNLSEIGMFMPVMRDENVQIGISRESMLPSNWSLAHCTRTPCRLEQFYVYDSVKHFKPNKTLVSVMFPENGELVVNYKPKVTLWEFLTLFGSVFGLWLGVNGLAAGQFVYIGLRKLSSRLC